MKKLLVLICLLGGSAIYAQAPQFLNYQGIARDASGSVVTSNIGIKFEILQGSTPVYTEEQSVTPSAAGVFTAAIGNGINQVGVFSSINWATGPYSIRVSIDPTGGTSYSTVGTSQLLSVPYALYAEKAGNTQTVNITGPNVTGTYPNFTINPPGALTASTGISITGGTITNTAPNQTVNITGPNVIGAYPDYTITPAALTASTGISITGGTITNTAPNPTLIPSGITSVTGTHPSFTIDVPPPALNYNTGTNVLTLTQGTAVATTTLVGAGSNTVAMFSQGIASVSPVGAGSSFTISVQSPTFTSAGPTTISGTYPNFVVTSPAASTVAATNLQINPPHTASTLSASNYSINIAPTNITGAGVSGSYPNYTITSAAQTSVTSGGSNVVVSGSAPSYTISAATPTLQINAPNTITPLALNNYSINVQPTTLAGAGVATVSGSHPNYVVGVPAASISATGNTLTVTQGTSVSTATLGGGPWTVTSGIIHPAANPSTNKVAVGQSSGNAMLEVMLTPAGNNTLNPVVQVLNQNTALTSPVFRVENNGASTAAVTIDNNGPNGDGIQLNVNGTSNGSTALQVNHNGIGYAGYFSNNNTSSNARLLNLNHSGLGGLIYGTMTNSLSSADAINIFAGGSGNGFFLSKIGTGVGVNINHGGTSGSAGYFNSTNTSNPSQALTVQNAGSGDAFGAYHTGNGRALFATNTSSFETAMISNTSNGRAMQITNNGNNETVYMANLGAGPVLYATNNASFDVAQFNNTGTARSVVATNNSNSETIFALNTGSGKSIQANNTSSVNPTVLFNNSGNNYAMTAQNSSAVMNRAAFIIGGLDVMGKTTGAGTFPLVVTNIGSTNLFNVRDDGNVGVGVANPTVRLHVIEGSNTTAAIFASQTTAASSANAHGVYGLSNNSNPTASGVRGENNGAGPGVYGNKIAGTGPAGRFDIGSTTNGADAVIAQTNGQGAAIHAINGPTVAGSSNAAVWLENGHLKSTSPASPTQFSVAVAGGFTMPGFAPTCVGTDVKGVISFSTSATGFAGTAFIDVQYNFQKSYAVAPTVLITPITDLRGLSFMVLTASPANFIVRVYRTNGAPFPTTLGATTFSFNYFIIE